MPMKGEFVAACLGRQGDWTGKNRGKPISLPQYSEELADALGKREEPKKKKKNNHREGAPNMPGIV